MMLCIERNLHIISTEAKERSDRRYVARYFPNGTARRWGVYDQKQQRYLKNREVNALSEREVREVL